MTRKDTDEMRRYVERGGHLSGNEWLIYKLFWEQGLSHARVAEQLGSRKERVYETIKRIRIKLFKAKLPPMGGTP